MLSLVANRMLAEVIHTLGIKVKVAYIIAQDIDLRITATQVSQLAAEDILRIRAAMDTLVDQKLVIRGDHKLVIRGLVVELQLVIFNMAQICFPGLLHSHLSFKLCFFQFSSA